MCVACRIDMGGMAMCVISHSSGWQDSCIYVLFHLHDVTHLYVCHDSFTCVDDSQTLRFVSSAICAMTHLHVCHDSFTCVDDSQTLRFTSSAMCAMTHSYVCHDSFTCVDDSQTSVRRHQGDLQRRPSPSKR